MVQPDPSSARRRADPGHAEPIVRSLEDRLLFRQAQAVLVGLTDCGQVDAARSLRSTAAELSLDVAAVAGRFLGHLDDSSAEPAKTFLLRIAVLALLPDGGARAGGPGGRDVEVTTSSTGRSSARGVPDAPTVPLGHARTRPVAGVVRSSNGEECHLDLAGLTYLDGAGLRVLEVLTASVRDGGSPLRVTLPMSAELRRLLRFAVVMRWLPAEFQGTSPASLRPDGDRPAVGPSGAAPAPGRAARLAEFDALFDRHASACLSLARHLVGDDHEAEDVVQKAFLDTWQQLSTDAPQAGQAGAQLLRRTHREAVHRLREARTGPEPSPRAPAGGPPGAPGRRRLATRAPSDRRAGLPALPEQQARPLRLAFWTGLTVQQIAATTGTPLTDVRADMLAGVRTLSHAQDHPAPPRRGGLPHGGVPS